MKNKLKLILIFLIMILVVVMGLVFAENGEEIIKIGSLEIIGENIEHSSEGGLHEIIFNENSFIEVKTEGGDIKRYEDFFKGALFIFNENGELVEASFKATKSKNYYLAGYEFYVSENSNVLYKNGKVNIGVPVRSEIKEPVKIDLSVKDLEFAWSTFEGKPVVLSDGIEFIGVLRYDSKGLFFKENVKISGKEIFNSNENKIYLDFDGEEKNTDYAYISIGKKDFIMFSSDEENAFAVNFPVGDEFARVEKNDHFAVKVIDGVVFLKNRVIDDDSLLNDKVILEEINGDAIIDNDYYTYKSIDGEVVGKRGVGIKEIWGDFSKTSTVASEVLFKDKKGSLIIKKDYKLLVSNFNEFLWVPFDAEEGDLEESYIGTNLLKKASVRLSYNYPSEESFEEQTGIELLFGFYENSIKPEHIRLLKEFYDSLTEDVQKEMVGKTIKLTPERAAYGGTMGINFPGRVFLSESQRWGRYSYVFNIFDHEASHVWHYSLGIGPESLDVKDEKYEQGQEFLKEIKEVQGVFNLDNIRFWSFEPKFGFTYGYGTTNIYEYIATYGEFLNRPDYWESLINAENPNHKTYRASLGLLWKYGRATDEQVNNIFSSSNLVSDENALLGYIKDALLGYIKDAKNDPWLHDSKSLELVPEKYRRFR